MYKILNIYYILYTHFVSCNIGYIDNYLEDVDKRKKRFGY